MSVVNNFIDFMRLKDNVDEYDDPYEEEAGFFDDGYEPEESYEPAPEPEKEIEPQRTVKRYSSSKVAPIKSRRNSAYVESGLQVCVIKPVSIDEARNVTDTLLDGRAVVLNLEGLDVEIAQRIIDFTSGSCYALRGNLQKISNYIFIITPKSVEISGDFADIFGGNNSDVPTI